MGKKKWSKGKLREKRNHKVVYNGQSDLDKVLKEVPKKIKVITVYSLVEAYKINGSLARRTIRELLKRGTIKTVLKSAHLGIYTKSAKAAREHKKNRSEKCSSWHLHQICESSERAQKRESSESSESGEKRKERKEIQGR